MRTRTRFFVCLSALLFFPHVLFAAIQLTQIVSGLSSPTFVGNAGDGSNRLFILEQAGVIKVLHQGSSTPTVFLDIHTKVVMNGEEGLLGLAFHPSYGANHRFFVYYSRVGDGAEVIAEYHTSANDPDVADPAETQLLVIPHPTNTNHNGGMLAFSPNDGYLYIGVGDGGSANDPPNNAQNIDVLLGKILRIDVDHPVGGLPYSSPAGNPFLNAPGSDEIFALGLRNPWRFSFDRLTGQQWVGDVGQSAHEEVDTPIVAGGNYGWRVYEGFSCTGNDPSLCSNNYLQPIFDYPHTGGRCSITGGYVYRGSQGALPAGTYIYGDYCSGEILTWNGSGQVLALDTTLNISSFGEDEEGELYVVNLGGTISKIVSTVSCTFSIAPSSASYTTAGGSGNVAVTTASGCGWSAVANQTWIHVPPGASGNGNGSVSYSVDANLGSARTGSMTIAGQTFSVNQDGSGVTCTFSISPTKASYLAVGGSGTATVTAPLGCPWTAVSNVPWITITSPSDGSGSGSATVSYSVAVYTGKPKNRNGTMTIAGTTLQVKQTK
jgi:glucose/arabinose dehydrogenase